MDVYLTSLKKAFERKSGPLLEAIQDASESSGDGKSSAS